MKRFRELRSGDHFRTEPIITGEFRSFLKVGDLALEEGHMVPQVIHDLTPVEVIEKTCAAI